MSDSDNNGASTTASALLDLLNELIDEHGPSGLGDSLLPEHRAEQMRHAAQDLGPRVSKPDLLEWLVELKKSNPDKFWQINCAPGPMSLWTASERLSYANARPADLKRSPLLTSFPKLPDDLKNASASAKLEWVNEQLQKAGRK